MKARQVILAVVLMLAGMVLAGCGPVGIVYSRSNCGDSECIKVSDGKGGSIPKRVSIGEHPGCVEDARWPDCKGGGR